MSIKHYGLDSEEIEHLKAAHLTDEEINHLNKVRLDEQIEDENEDDGDDEIERIAKLLPGVHEAVIGYIATDPSWHNKKKDDGYIKEAFEKINRVGIQNLNSALASIFNPIASNPYLEYDYSYDNMDTLIGAQEKAVAECSTEADASFDEISKVVDALSLSKEGICNIIG